jgi:hypothetical protein
MTTFAVIKVAVGSWRCFPRFIGPVNRPGEAKEQRYEWDGTEGRAKTGESDKNPQSAIRRLLLKNHFHGQLQKVEVGYFAGNRSRREIVGTLMEKFCLVKI